MSSGVTPYLLLSPNDARKATKAGDNLIAGCRDMSGRVTPVIVYEDHRLAAARDAIGELDISDANAPRGVGQAHRRK